MLAQLQYQCQELRTVAQVAEVERDKLNELMKIVQERWEILQYLGVSVSQCPMVAYASNLKWDKLNELMKIVQER